MKTNKFETPELEIVCLEVEDVVTASLHDGDDLGEDIFDDGWKQE